MKKLKPLLLPALLGLIFLSSPWWTSRLRPMDYSGGRSRDELERMLRNTSAVGIMFGELRTALSDIMYIKTERYLHAGIAYIPHMEEEILSISGAIQEADEHEMLVGVIDDHDHHEDGHADIPALLRTRNTDFRGFIGDLHRAVKPWRDPAKTHIHTSGTELLPWFRMMTLNDPHYTRGYSLGGWWLSQLDPQGALEYLAEGVQNNPDDFQIRLAKGQVHIRIARHPDGSYDREQLIAALPLFSKAAELAADQRPSDWDDDDDNARWNRYMESDAFAAARMTVLILERLERHEEALQTARRFLELLGPDTILERHVGEYEN